MSIIVAVRKNGRTVLAADTLTSFSDDLLIPSENAATLKVRRIGGALLGSAGWAIYDRILDDFLERQADIRFDDEASIFSTFLELWKALHERYPFVNDQAQSRDSPFGDLDSAFLIANQSGIFKVSHDMDVCRFNQYFAIGSGSDYAIGALHHLYTTSADAVACASGAVATAVAFDAYCGGSTTVLEVEAEP